MIVIIIKVVFVIIIMIIIMMIVMINEGGSSQRRGGSTDSHPVRGTVGAPFGGETVEEVGDGQVDAAETCHVRTERRERRRSSRHGPRRKGEPSSILFCSG